MNETVEPRFLADRVDTALTDTRVVTVIGPRQAGKSTLVQQIVARSPAAEYVSLDDRETRIAAEEAPDEFVAKRKGMLAVDEVQRVPELLLAIKAEVDRDRRPGRFLLTGSSQPSANKDVSESLAGRVERLTLWPFSQEERAGKVGTFFDRLMSGDLPAPFDSDLDKRNYLERALAGGFPEALTRTDDRRAAWFDAYVDTVVERESPSIVGAPRSADLPRLLRLVAARHAGILNIANIADDAQLPRTTVKRHLEVLEAIFLTVRLPAWAANLNQREIRSPKILVADPGLAAHLRQAEIDDLVRPERAKGNDRPIIEGFVAAELLRMSAYSRLRPRLSHYRDQRGTEVDLIVEARGRVAAVEVKAGMSVDRSALRTLAGLRDGLGDRFVAGVVLHTGPRGQVLGDRLFSLPISALWQL